MKRKFIEDALTNSTSLRVASVYVIVLNREKTYDPLLNQKAFKSRKYIGDSKFIESSSEEDEAELAAKEEYNKKIDFIKSANDGSKKAKLNLIKGGHKRSMYDSDTNGNGDSNMNSTSASSNIAQFKKLLLERKDFQQNNNMSDSDKPIKPRKISSVSTGPTFKRVSKRDDDGVPYKY